MPSGSFSKLQDRGDRTDAVQVVRLRIVDVGLFLRDQHDALIGAHGYVEGLDGFLTPDEERNHHVGVDDDIPQGQHRHVLDAAGSLL